MKIKYRLPEAEHENQLSILLGQPNSRRVISDACNLVQEQMELAYGWPANKLLHGVLMHAMWDVYTAGEKRGEARAACPVAGLFPISEHFEPQPSEAE